MARGARGMSKRASAKTWKASAGKIHKGNEPSRKRGGRRR